MFQASSKIQRLLQVLHSVPATVFCASYASMCIVLYATLHATGTQWNDDPPVPLPANPDCPVKHGTTVCMNSALENLCTCSACFVSPLLACFLYKPQLKCSGASQLALQLGFVGLVHT